jgi:hypothetical protein
MTIQGPFRIFDQDAADAAGDRRRVCRRPHAARLRPGEDGTVSTLAEAMTRRMEMAFCRRRLSDLEIHDATGVAVPAEALTFPALPPNAVYNESLDRIEIEEADGRRFEIRVATLGGVTIAKRDCGYGEQRDKPVFVDSIEHAYAMLHSPAAPQAETRRGGADGPSGDAGADEAVRDRGGKDG